MWILGAVAALSLTGTALAGPIGTQWGGGSGYFGFNSFGYYGSHTVPTYSFGGGFELEDGLLHSLLTGIDWSSLLSYFDGNYSNNWYKPSVSVPEPTTLGLLGLGLIGIGVLRHRRLRSAQN
jgi:hypothetical protein